MKVPQISHNVGLIIVVPVILGMLITGIVMWPSAEEQKQHEQRQKEKADSLKALETSFRLSEELTPQEFRESLLDDNI